MPLYKRYAKELNLRARDLMASPPITISEESTIEEASETMWERKVGSLMVTAEDGTLSGIVTERDLIFAISRSMIGKGLPVSHIMSRNVLTTSIDENISVAIERMRQGNIRHLPVTNEKGRPAGMISMRDLLDVGSSLMKIIIRSE